MLFPFQTPPPAARRVVITGAGVITALGQGWASNAEGFRTGRTAFAPVTLFDVSRQRVQTAAQATLPTDFSRPGLSGRAVHRLDRAARLLLSAATEAWEQSGWQGVDDLPVVLGTTSGGMTLGQDYYRLAMERPRSSRQQASRVAHYQAQRQALDLADAFSFNGPVTIIANACASGANALGHAWSLIRTGRADKALAGGYDALSQLVFAGFDSLQALSPTQCRPFAADRDGLALGEGAAVFTLESADDAVSRGATILGEICGYGAANDAHHLTQPHPQGDAALASMQMACASANLEPGQIDYINAHGTATPLNDGAEAEAINRWARGAQVPVSSTKASIGHLLGAAGAVEAAVCLMAMNGGWLPPNRATLEVDPICRFPLVTEPQSADVRTALTNSFGFGGANATLILRRWE